jgi:hypothetical protein
VASKRGAAFDFLILGGGRRLFVPAVTDPGALVRKRADMLTLALRGETVVPGLVAEAEIAAVAGAGRGFADFAPQVIGAVARDTFEAATWHELLSSAAS